MKKLEKLEKLEKMQNMYLSSIKNKDINKSLKKIKEQLYAILNITKIKNFRINTIYLFIIKIKTRKENYYFLEYNKLLEENIKIESQNEMILEKIEILEHEIEFINGSNLDALYIEYKALKKKKRLLNINSTI